MSFREKIDKILKTNKLGINTVFGLEAFVKASPGAISKPMKKGEEPGLGTIKKIQDGLPGLNLDWWETGKGETFTENPTPASNSTGSDEIENPDKMYRDFVEGKTEYLLIPRSILQEKYRLVSIEQMQSSIRTIDKLLDANDKMQERITQLEREAEGLRKPPVPAKGKVVSA